MTRGMRRVQLREEAVGAKRAERTSSRGGLGGMVRGGLGGHVPGGWTRPKRSPPPPRRHG
eukprot:5246814-Pyramimonas_sp.AAC.1